MRGLRTHNLTLNKMEAKITINGIELTEAQSMSVRTAVANSLMNLSDEKFMEDMGPIGPPLQQRLSEVQKAIFRNQG